MVYEIATLLFAGTRIPASCLTSWALIAKRKRTTFFRYLFGNLKVLADPMPSYIESILRAKLKKGNGRFQDAMIISCPWDTETYTPALAKAVDEFKEAEKSFNDFYDDIPF